MNASMATLKRAPSTIATMTPGDIPWRDGVVEFESMTGELDGGTGGKLWPVKERESSHSVCPGATWDIIVRLCSLSSRSDTVIRGNRDDGGENPD